MRPTVYHLSWALFVLANVLGLLLIFSFGPSHTEAGAAAIIACNFILLVRAAASNRALLLPLLFAIVFALFHFSLLPISLLDEQYLYGHPYFSRWYFGPFTAQAYIAATIFFVGLTAGVLLLWRRDTVPDQGVGIGVKQPRSDVLLFIFAGLVAYFYFAIFIILGIGNYAEYNAFARGEGGGFVQQSLTFLYPAIGALTMLCADRVRSLKLFLMIFVVWGVPAFITGLRGEVLFPAALMMPLLLRRLDLRFRLVPIALASAALLWLVSFGRIIRRQEDFSSALNGASLVDGLAELGGSLRPVYEVERWIQSGILEFQWGATYWAPIERLSQKLLPFTDPIPAMVDGRLMNVSIVKLAGGAYGFSIAAEAFINFGLLGAAAIGLLTGIVLTRIGRQFAAGRPGIFAVALAYAFFYHIRQSYVGAWGSFLIVSVIATVLIWLDSTARSHLREPRQRMAT